MSREVILAKIEAWPEESRRQRLVFLDVLAGQADHAPTPADAPGFR